MKKNRIHIVTYSLINTRFLAIKPHTNSHFKSETSTQCLSYSTVNSLPARKHIVEFHIMSPWCKRCRWPYFSGRNGKLSNHFMLNHRICNGRIINEKSSSIEGFEITISYAGPTIRPVGPLMARPLYRTHGLSITPPLWTIRSPRAGPSPLPFPHVDHTLLIVLVIKPEQIPLKINIDSALADDTRVPYCNFNFLTNFD